MFQKLLRAAGKSQLLVTGGHWYQKRKMRAGDKGKMAKTVISSEKQKEFGACMIVWVHLKDNSFLSAIGFLCLSVLSYHQTFQNKSSQLLPLQDNQDINHTLPQATMLVCTKASPK